jgi:hypothetical protein
MYISRSEMYDYLLIFSSFRVLVEIHEWTQKVLLIMLFLWIGEQKWGLIFLWNALD